MVETAISQNSDTKMATNQNGDNSFTLQLGRRHTKTATSQDGDKSIFAVLVCRRFDHTLFSLSSF